MALKAFRVKILTLVAMAFLFSCAEVPTRGGQQSLIRQELVLRPGKYLDLVYHDGYARFDALDLPIQMHSIETGQAKNIREVPAEKYIEMLRNELLKYPDLFTDSYNGHYVLSLSVAEIWQADPQEQPLVKIEGIIQKNGRTVFAFQNALDDTKSPVPEDFSLREQMNHSLTDFTEKLVREILDIKTNL